MKSDMIAALLAKFESIVRHERGTEFWFARELQELLGYTQWRNFLIAMEKAREACQKAGQKVADHFADVSKMVRLGSGAERVLEDVAMTRYACYLLAQNGDPRKEAVAFAQSYFAVQTRRQEMLEARLIEQRVHARHRLGDGERGLSAVIFERLADGQSFARIRSKGARALFGGLTTEQMKARLGVPDERPLADFLPAVTIKAQDFANELTAHNTKEHDLRTEGAIIREHVDNNTEVRLMLGVRGIKPEELPAAEDKKKIERRFAAGARKLPKPPAQVEADDEEGGDP